MTSKVLNLLAGAAAAAMMLSGPVRADEIWSVKCFDTEGHSMAVKAISGDAVTYDVKAIKGAKPDLMNVKAVTEGGERHAVKVVTSKARQPYSDVKVVTKAGKLLPVKAITGRGEILDVKAFANKETGEFDIKCLGGGGDTRLGIKAIAPDGEVFDVKGLKELPDEVELDVDIEAHIKAKPQG